MKKVSVIITSYNQKEYLKEAIESVLNQTDRPFEIIVCDDASGDGSRDLIRDYGEKYPGLVKGILHKENLGISKNRNSGMRAVQGDLVTWLDGDDIFRLRKLELELERFDSDPDVKWVYSQVIEIDLENNIICGRYRDFFKGMIFENVISMLGCAPRNPLVDFRALKKVGFFRENMELYEDFDLCLRLAKFYKCSYCREPLVEYRIHSGGLHKAMADKHIVNFQKLHDNLAKLLEHEPEKTKHRLERRFLRRQRTLLLGKEIEEGQGLATLLGLFKEIKCDPLMSFSPITYVTFMKVVLPAHIIRLISKVIRGLER